MLLGPDAEVTPLRPPAADEPAERQLRELAAALSSALATWGGAGLMGMQLAQVTRASAPDQLCAAAGAVAWRMQALGVALPPALAASLVCLSLGGQPDDEGGPLTGLDLAVLDIWARRALGAVAERLELEPGAAERASIAEMRAEWPGPTAVAHVPSAAGEALLLLGWDQVARVRGAGGPRLGDHPGLLRGLRVPVEARLGGADLPLADLLAAAEGDVVMLGGQADAAVGLYVGGHRIARGRPGVRSGKMAMKVDHTDEPALRGEHRP